MTVSERYYWIFRRSPVMAVLFDANGNFEDVSDAFAARLGFDRESMVGKKSTQFATAESAERIINEFLPKLRRMGQIRNQPVEFLDADSEPVEMLASALSEHDQDGAMLGTVAVYTEVSDKARIEKKFRRLYRQTPAMLHTVDDTSCITAVSNHWLQKLGYKDRSEVLGRSINDFLTPDFREPIGAQTVQRIREEGGLTNVARKMLRRDGSVIDVVVSSINDADNHRGSERLLVASKDVTERNQSERALREALEENARLREELQDERDYLREEINVSMNFGRIVGTSPAMSNMLSQIQAVAATPASVLILGESGVGKELIAHALHAQSPRAEQPLVKVNCASIPEELFESEFFGHVKGAFTGAIKDRIGRFQLADGGTIFLDEVGEIPLELQGKLLRVLQEQEFERVGDDQTRSIDVRIIAATNRNLPQLVEQGLFREDLYYRISVFPIEAPPLRKRGDDVIQIAQHFLIQTCKDFGRQGLVLTPSDIETLRAYDWPGNVRELKNVIERAVILSPGPSLRLDLSLPDNKVAISASSMAPAVIPMDGFVTEREMKSQVRRNLISALDAADWRVAGRGGAAELLGMRPSTLSDRIKRLGLSRERQDNARPS